MPPCAHTLFHTMHSHTHSHHGLTRTHTMGSHAHTHTMCSHAHTPCTQNAHAYMQTHVLTHSHHALTHTCSHHVLTHTPCTCTHTMCSHTRVLTMLTPCAHMHTLISQACIHPVAEKTKDVRILFCSYFCVVWIHNSQTDHQSYGGSSLKIYVTGPHPRHMESYLQSISRG